MTVHLVEPGGRGGIHQHAAALARALAERGVPVDFHTAAGAELPGTAPPCTWPLPRLRPRIVHQAALVAAWLGRGVPSCLRDVRAGDTVQVEGWFRPVLLVPLVAGARRRRARVVLSPHTTFDRSKGRLSEAVMAWLARRADVVFVTSWRDGERVRSWGATPAQVGLVVDPAPPDPALVDAWRSRWRAGDHERRTVLFAGLVRPDKGLDVLVRAAALWPRHLALVVVGEDAGALGPARRLAAELGVHMDVEEGYQPLDRFVAAVAAADVAACPHRRAGQSAVLALAASLGRPSVATDVGGLPDLASVVVPVDDPPTLARGVMLALGAPPAVPPPDPVAPHLAAYGFERT